MRVLAAALLVLGACASGAPDAPEATVTSGAVGASIAVKNSVLYVVNADQGSVSAVDEATLAPLREAVVGAEPHALLLLGDRVLVTTYRGGEIVVLDAATFAVRARAPVCAGAWGIAASPDSKSVYVACEARGAVLRVDPDSLAVTTLADGFFRPRALIATSAGVVVADFIGGALHVIHDDGTLDLVSLVPPAAPYRPALTTMTANLTTAIAAVPGGIVVAHTLVNHDGDASVEPIADDYGSITDGHPKINPAVTALAWQHGALVPRADRPVSYATFDGSFRAFCAPEALAVTSAGAVLVANVASKSVAVIDRDAVDPTARATAAFHVGAGPSGVAIDDAACVAFVDNAFDASISRLDLTTPKGGLTEATTTLVRPLAATYSPAALAGRKLFYGADDPHLTPAGVVACASCHPNGGDDGLVWFVHTSQIALKRRRTPHLANAKMGTSPFHWSGEFSTLDDLTTHTIQDLMAGDALVEPVADVAAYVEEIVAAAPAEPVDPDAAVRGRAAFDQYGCSTCHAGVALTDQALHAPLAPMSLSADDVLLEADTPALHGLGNRAPYFHDGRAKSLRDVLTMPGAEAHRGALPDDAIADVVAYLSTL